MYLSKENYLCHYGKKGMRWGQRRDNVPLLNSPKSKLSNDQKESMIFDKKLANRHASEIRKTTKNIQYYKKLQTDMEQNGSQSKAFIKEYGHMSDDEFKKFHGISKETALKESIDYLIRNTKYSEESIELGKSMLQKISDRNNGLNLNTMTIKEIKEM